MTTTSAAALPQLGDQVFLTDGGIETTLIHHHGVDLPEFAAFVLLQHAAGRSALRRYFDSYLDLAQATATGLVLETATWRASPGWGALLGYSREALADANREAVALLAELRAERGPLTAPVVISGCLGPRGDGYQPESLMSATQSEDYHSEQIASFCGTDAQLVTAITMTHSGEAVGIARAAEAHGLPSVISFTVETDGRLPSGEALAEAVRVVDEATGAAPAYYMVNCAHPSHVAPTLVAGREWNARVRGLRANASTMSHAELDEADTLDIGDIEDFGAWYARLRERLPQLTVLGGCCGTDTRHIDAVRRACLT
ncbi:homocysteine S-methyltransferase family protein [Nocardioides taihuensis]|uniref:Homocysteine S-methyltransferase family protein n=1 Tax=Nocardioides taihuensis TaxID=1835606 RepID=A0ABW0BNT3_9ACTN